MADDILIRIDADGRRAESEIKKTGRALQGLGKEAQSSGRAARAAGAAWQQQQRTLSQLGTAATRTAQGLSAVTAAGAAYAVKQGIQYNAALESNRMALSKLAGDTKTANRLLRDLQETAKKTPFEFRDITDAARKFLAFGFSVKDTEKALKATGDAAAALGGSKALIDQITLALGQIQAKGRVQGDELLQLAEAGINARKILQRELKLTAVELDGLMQDGALSAKRALPALIRGLQEDFKGAAEAQSRTFEGQMSTLRDNVDQTLGAMTEGLFMEMKRWLPEVNRTAEGISAVWKRKDLSPEEKFRESRRIVDRELGPLFDLIQQKVAEADIPGKIGEAISKAAPQIAEGAGKLAVAGAKAFGEAFVKADPLGKAVLAGYIAKKAGLFSALAGGAKGGGGGAGALGSLLGKERGGSPANPLYVLSVNGGGGPGGGPAPAGGKPGGGRLPGLGIPGAIALTAVSSIPDQDPELSKRLWKDLVETHVISTRRINQAIKSVGDAFDALETKEGRFAARMTGELDKLAGSGDKSLTQIRRSAERNAERIKKVLGEDSKRGKELLAQNFSAAASAVAASMDRAGGATKEGTAQINSYLRKALAEFGITGKQATRYLNDQDTMTGKPLSPNGNPGRGAARGMLNRLPGGVGPDSIPMAVNGRNIMAAPGEDVAIINRHQRAVLDQRLADMGGLGGLFRQVNTPHNHSGPGYAKGGLVTGDTDFLPALGTRLRAMSQSTGRPIFVQSGRRSMAEQASLYARYKGLRPVAAPSPNAPHVRGVAADITPGRGVFGGVAGRFGLAFTVPSEDWHIQLAGAVAAGEITPAQAEQIKRAKWNGPGGALGQLGQAGLDRYRSAAQSVLDKAAASSSGGDGALTGGGKSSAGGAYDKNALKRLWVDAGGDPSVANLMAAIALAESAGDPTARNPSGASGLWQILGLPFPGNVFDPLTNARMAVSKYQSQGLGAWEAYTKGTHRQFLARGGLIGAATGFMSSTKTDGKTRAKVPRKVRGKKMAGGLRGLKALGKPRIKLDADYPSNLLEQIATLEDDTIPFLTRVLGQQVRADERSDEDGMLTELEGLASDGKLNQEDVNTRFGSIVGAHVKELQTQQLQQGTIYNTYLSLERKVQQAVREIKAVIKERRERYQRLLADVRENTKDIRSTQAQYETEARKKGKARDPKKVKALATRLDRLRDRRQQLIGQRELATGPLDEITGGELGTAHSSLSSAMQRLPEFEAKAKTAPLDTADAKADWDDFAAEITRWTGKTAPTLNVTADDGGQSDREAAFYKQQATQALTERDVANAQFATFKGFENLAGLRFLGAFAQGVTNVDRTGLAILHQGETVTPRPDGAYRDRTTMTAPAAPTEVYVTIEGDMAGLVRVVDARVRQGQAGSIGVGQRARRISNAPGR